MLRPTGVVFAKKITGNYSWNTAVHNTTHTTTLATCYVSGKLVYPGDDEQEVIDVMLVNPTSIWPN